MTTVLQQRLEQVHLERLETLKDAKGYCFWSTNGARAAAFGVIAESRLVRGISWVKIVVLDVTQETTTGVFQKKTVRRDYETSVEWTTAEDFEKRFQKPELISPGDYESIPFGSTAGHFVCGFANMLLNMEQWKHPCEEPT